MMNWKTTVAGLLAALLPIAAQMFPQYAPLIAPVGSAAVAALGFFAADASHPVLQPPKKS